MRLLPMHTAGSFKSPSHTYLCISGRRRTKKKNSEQDADSDGSSLAKSAKLQAANWGSGKCLGRLQPHGFPSSCFWLMEMCGPELGEQLVREKQLSLKSAHSLFFLKLELSPMVKFCATFPSREPELSPSILWLYLNMHSARNKPSKSMVWSRNGTFLAG